MNKPIDPRSLEPFRVTTGPLPASAQALLPRARLPRKWETCASPSRDRPPPEREGRPRPRLRHHRPLHRSRCRHRRPRRPACRPQRLDRRARRRRSLRRPPREAGRQRQCLRRKAGHRVPQSAPALTRQARQAAHPAPVRPRRHHHAGDGLRRPPRKPLPRRRPRRRGAPQTGRRRFRRRDPRLRHPRIRPQRNRPRPRHHPGQHQPPGARADDHRPQLPGEDQRQHRQQRRHLLHGRRSREDGLGHPLGRRHGDGPLHRPQHPQHPRMDHPQRARPHRHRADLPGARKSRRRSRRARLGSLPRHADRTGRTGRRLFHHPRRRAPRLHPPHRQARHRHRLAAAARSWRTGALASQGELPLRTLRRDLRDHGRLRRLASRSATACAPAPSPTPTTPRNSPNSKPSASSPRSPGRRAAR